ncbi:MAG: hypothetical protein PVG08_19145 [Desulfobacterales bacterium]
MVRSDVGMTGEVTLRGARLTCWRN